MLRLAFVLSLLSTAALAQATDPSCHTPDEVSSYYGDTVQTTGDFYEDRGDITNIINALENELTDGAPPPGGTPSLIAVIINLDDMRTDFIMYDSMGCAQDHLGPVPRDETEAIMAEAGVDPPFSDVPEPPVQPKAQGGRSI